MYRLTKSVTIDVAHRLMHHPGRCSNIHGHTYKLELTLGFDEVNPVTSMARDFADIKDQLKKTADLWDHALLLNSGDPLLGFLAGYEGPLLIWPFQGDPTAENMAHHMAHRLVCNMGADSNLQEVEATVWETPTSKVTYRMVRRGEDKWKAS